MIIPIINSRIFAVDIDKILPGKNQARKNYDPTALIALAQSIRLYGIIQPVTLRRKNGAFELVAGERRIRAARMAGLKKVPAIIQKMRDETAAAVSLCENLQREQLSYFEQAHGYSEHMSSCRITSDELAKKVCGDKNVIDERLRALSLALPVQQRFTSLALSEKYIPALMVSGCAEIQLEIINEIVRESLSPHQAVGFALEICGKTPPKPVRKQVVNDVKIYVNTIEQSAEMINKLGGEVSAVKTQEGEYIHYSIKIKAQSVQV